MYSSPNSFRPGDLAICVDTTWQAGNSKEPNRVLLWPELMEVYTVHKCNLDGINLLELNPVTEKPNEFVIPWFFPWHFLRISKDDLIEYEKSGEIVEKSPETNDDVRNVGLVYTIHPKIPLRFFNLIIRIDSLKKSFKSLEFFDFILNGHTMIFNERIGIISVVCSLYFNEIIEHFLESGMKYGDDFILVETPAIFGIQRPDMEPQTINVPVGECQNTTWLNSIVTLDGCYVWWKGH